MDDGTVDTDPDLTSTISDSLLSTKNDKGDANDSTPTSSTDASSTFAGIYSTISEDPISSTSSDVMEKDKLLSSMKNENKDAVASKNLLGTDGDVDLLDMNIANVSSELISEDVEDIVQDLENLLGEPEPQHDFLTRRKEKSPSKEKDLLTSLDNPQTEDNDPKLCPPFLEEAKIAATPETHEIKEVVTEESSSTNTETSTNVELGEASTSSEKLEIKEQPGELETSEQSQNSTETTTHNVAIEDKPAGNEVIAVSSSEVGANTEVHSDSIGKNNAVGEVIEEKVEMQLDSNIIDSAQLVEQAEEQSKSELLSCILRSSEIKEKEIDALSQMEPENKEIPCVIDSKEDETTQICDDSSTEEGAGDVKEDEKATTEIKSMEPSEEVIQLDEIVENNLAPLSSSDEAVVSESNPFSGLAAEDETQESSGSSSVVLEGCSTNIEMEADTSDLNKKISVNVTSTSEPSKITNNVVETESPASSMVQQIEEVSQESSSNALYPSDTCSIGIETKDVTSPESKGSSLNVTSSSECPSKLESVESKNLVLTDNNSQNSEANLDMPKEIIECEELPPKYPGQNLVDYEISSPSEGNTCEEIEVPEEEIPEENIPSTAEIGDVTDENTVSEQEPEIDQSIVMETSMTNEYNSSSLSHTEEITEEKPVSPSPDTLLVEETSKPEEIESIENQEVEEERLMPSNDIVDEDDSEVSMECTKEEQGTIENKPLVNQAIESPNEEKLEVTCGENPSELSTVDLLERETVTIEKIVEEAIQDEVVHQNIETNISQSAIEEDSNENEPIKEGNTLEAFTVVTEPIIEDGNKRHSGEPEKNIAQEIPVEVEEEVKNNIIQETEQFSNAADEDIVKEDNNSPIAEMELDTGEMSSLVLSPEGDNTEITDNLENDDIDNLNTKVLEGISAAILEQQIVETKVQNMSSLETPINDLQNIIEGNLVPVNEELCVKKVIIYEHDCDSLKSSHGSSLNEEKHKFSSDAFEVETEDKSDKVSDEIFDAAEDSSVSIQRPKAESDELPGQEIGTVHDKHQTSISDDIQSEKMEVEKDETIPEQQPETIQLDKIIQSPVASIPEEQQETHQSEEIMLSEDGQSMPDKQTLEPETVQSEEMIQSQQDPPIFEEQESVPSDEKVQPEEGPLIPEEQETVQPEEKLQSSQDPPIPEEQESVQSDETVQPEENPSIPEEQKTVQPEENLSIPEEQETVQPEEKIQSLQDPPISEEQESVQSDETVQPEENTLIPEQQEAVQFEEDPAIPEEKQETVQFEEDPSIPEEKHETIQSDEIEQSPQDPLIPEEQEETVQSHETIQSSEDPSLPRQQVPEEKQEIDQPGETIQSPVELPTSENQQTPVASDKTSQSEEGLSIPEQQAQTVEPEEIIILPGDSSIQDQQQQMLENFSDNASVSEQQIQSKTAKIDVPPQESIPAPADSSPQSAELEDLAPSNETVLSPLHGQEQNQSEIPPPQVIESASHKMNDSSVSDEQKQVPAPSENLSVQDLESDSNEIVQASVNSSTPDQPQQLRQSEDQNEQIHEDISSSEKAKMEIAEAIRNIDMNFEEEITADEPTSLEENTKVNQKPEVSSSDQHNIEASVDGTNQLEISCQPNSMTKDSEVMESPLEETTETLPVHSMVDQTSAAVQSILDNMLTEERHSEKIVQKEETPVVHSSYSSYEVQKAVQEIQCITLTEDIAEMSPEAIECISSSQQPSSSVKTDLETSSIQKSDAAVESIISKSKESQETIPNEDIQMDTIKQGVTEEILIEKVQSVQELTSSPEYNQEIVTQSCIDEDQDGVVEVSEEESPVQSKEESSSGITQQNEPVVVPSIDLSEESSSEEGSDEDKKKNVVSSSSNFEEKEVKSLPKTPTKVSSSLLTKSESKKFSPRETRHSSRISERGKPHNFREDIEQPLSVNIDEVEREKPYSPKITIKPIKEDDPSEDKEEHKGSLKITITKQSDNTHSILKMCSPDFEHRQKQTSENDEQNTVPKLVIKTSDAHSDQHSPKISTRSSKQVPANSNIRSGSPRITIKPIIKPDAKETITSPLKITIKPIGKPEEFSRQQQRHSPKTKVKSDDDHYSTRSKVIKLSENSDVHSPKVTIKPVKPPEEPEILTTPKITIKPIEKPEEARVSPKITIKPVLKPVEVETEVEEEVKERIVLKINKGNLPSKDAEKISRESRKREQEEDKSEKLAKIKLKFSKDGDAHIVHKKDSDSQFSNKRQHDFETERSKRLKLDTDSDDDVKLIETRQSPIVISEDSQSQDSVIIIENTKDPLADVPMPEPKPQVPIVTPRKRGRPRKVPLVVREDFESEQQREKVGLALTSPSPVLTPEPASDTESSTGRPKRSCRAQSVRDTLGIKPRKPSKPRGGKRGAGAKAISPRAEKEPRLSEGKIDVAQSSLTEEAIQVARGSGILTIACGSSAEPDEPIKPLGLKGLLEAAKDQNIIEVIEIDTPSNSPKCPEPSVVEEDCVVEEELKIDQTEKDIEIIAEKEVLDLREDVDLNKEPCDFGGTDAAVSDVDMQPPTPVFAPPLSETSAIDISNTTDIAMFEEETRMSADVSSRAQTPAKQVMSADVVVEESQSSMQSTATTESGKISRRSRLEVHQDQDGSVFTADQLNEYYWGGNGPFMIQEQVAQYLGIKSFKRKYPGIPRRMVDMQERDYIRENGLASESMCDLGLTAVNSADILDIMYTDFQEKYEEFCRFQRDKQAKDLLNKQKALSLAANQEKSKLDILEQAVQSAAAYNANFNKARREQRRACMDLQTMNIHYPKGKLKKITMPKIGHYPVAVVPGQFTDYYKEFTPTELNNLPLNTMLYNELYKILPEVSDSDSDSSGSDSDDSSSSDSDSNSSCEENCKMCEKRSVTPRKSPVNSSI